MKLKVGDKVSVNSKTELPYYKGIIIRLYNVTGYGECAVILLDKQYHQDGYTLGENSNDKKLAQQWTKEKEPKVRYKTLSSNIVLTTCTSFSIDSSLL